MNKLDGKEVAQFLKEKNIELIKKIKEKNEEITLAIILPTNDPSSLSYLKGRMKMAENVGINIKTITFDNTPTQEELLIEIDNISEIIKITATSNNDNSPISLFPIIFKIIIKKKYKKNVFITILIYSSIISPYIF